MNAIKILKKALWSDDPIVFIASWAFLYIIALLIVMGVGFII